MAKRSKLALSMLVSITFTLLLTSCNFGFGSASTDRGDATSHYNAGLDFYAKKQYEGAITEFNEALRLKSDYAEAYVGRGNARYQFLLNHLQSSDTKTEAFQSDTDTMLADFDAAIKLNDQYADAYVGRAQATIFSNNLKQVKQGNWNASAADYVQPLADLDQAIKLKPDYAEAFVARARAHFAKSLAMSLASFDESIGRGVMPRSPSDEQRAAIDEEKHKAAADCEQAIKLRPNYAEAYATRADINIDSQDGKEADYTKAIELDPTNPDYYDKRATIAYYTQKYDAGISDYTRAIELDSSNPIRYYNRGSMYDNRGNNEKARSDYEQALKLGFNEPTFIHKLAELYFRKGMCKEAIPYYTQYTENLDESVSVTTTNAMNYLTLGGYQIELPEAYYNRGVCYKETGERDKAIADFKKTISLVRERHLENIYQTPGSTFPNLLGEATTGLRELGVEP